MLRLLRCAALRCAASGRVCCGSPLDALGARCLSVCLSVCLCVCVRERASLDLNLARRRPAVWPAPSAAVCARGERPSNMAQRRRRRPTDQMTGGEARRFDRIRWGPAGGGGCGAEGESGPVVCGCGGRWQRVGRTDRAGRVRVCVRVCVCVGCRWRVGLGLVGGTVGWGGDGVELSERWPASSPRLPSIASRVRPCRPLRSDSTRCEFFFFFPVGGQSKGRGLRKQKRFHNKKRKNQDQTNNNSKSKQRPGQREHG